jgi:hypothetical protein
MKVFSTKQIEQFDANMAKIGYTYEDMHYGDWYYRNKLGKEIRIVVGGDTIYGVIVNNEIEFSASNLVGQSQLYKKILNTLNIVGIRKQINEYPYNS